MSAAVVPTSMPAESARWTQTESRSSRRYVSAFGCRPSSSVQGWVASVRAGACIRPPFQAIASAPQCDRRRHVVHAPVHVEVLCYERWRRPAIHERDTDMSHLNRPDASVSSLGTRCREPGHTRSPHRSRSHSPTRVSTMRSYALPSGDTTDETPSPRQLQCLDDAAERRHLAAQRLDLRQHAAQCLNLRQHVEDCGGDKVRRWKRRACVRI